MVSTVAIVGGGPAGSSLAIRLRAEGFDVTLIERERFPRHKLCGEFISPECLAHFETLGVAAPMLTRGGDRITETIFYERGGRSLVIPSEWFGSSGGALGLSRAAMDLILLDRAKQVGVKVLESTRVVGLIVDDERVACLKIRQVGGHTDSIDADLIIDATGRSAVIGRMLDKKGSDKTAPTRPPLLGFKVHLSDIDLDPGRCEIYSFEGGYGGLSYVEDGAANFCFLIRAGTAKTFGGKAEYILAGPVMANKRAAVTLRNAKPVYDWLAVAVDRFGRKELSPAPNVVAVGDAAVFIDPFTGSGMLLAFESAEILARCITEYRTDHQAVRQAYNKRFDEAFLTRLRVSSVIRNAAYLPNAASLVIRFLGVSRATREFLTRTTRKGLSFSQNKQ